MSQRQSKKNVTLSKFQIISVTRTEIKEEVPAIPPAQYLKYIKCIN